MIAEAKAWAERVADEVSARAFWSLIALVTWGWGREREGWPTASDRASVHGAGGTLTRDRGQQAPEPARSSEPDVSHLYDYGSTEYGSACGKRGGWLVCAASFYGKPDRCPVCLTVADRADPRPLAREVADVLAGGGSPHRARALRAAVERSEAACFDVLCALDLDRLGVSPLRARVLALRAPVASPLPLNADRYKDPASTCAHPLTSRVVLVDRGDVEIGDGCARCGTSWLDADSGAARVHRDPQLFREVPRYPADRFSERFPARAS